MEKGDRVTLSEAARKAGIRRGDVDRVGTVTGVTKWVNVHWDGLGPKTIYSYHFDYITLALANGDGDRE